MSTPACRARAVIPFRKARAAALATTLLLAAARAAATPVYLSPTSLFPSGNYAREALEARTRASLSQRWLRLRARNGRMGWAPEELFLTLASQRGRGAFAPRQPLAANEVMVARDEMPLRAAPLPFAEVVISLAAGTRLTRVASAELRWGMASMRGIADGSRDGMSEAWWPMAEGFSEDGKKAGPPAGKRLTTAELFKRKIFDVATSASVPGLQFVSAQGVFRTTDGKSWARVAALKDGNFPLAVARSGAVFAGPYASFDHGETFQQFVKWDALIDALKATYEIDPARLQVLDIRALDPMGERLRLALEIGVGQPAVALTNDQGLTWLVVPPARLAGTSASATSVR